MPDVITVLKSFPTIKIAICYYTMSTKFGQIFGVPGCHIGCNMDTRDLPDTYVCPASGIHIRQIYIGAYIHM